MERIKNITIVTLSLCIFLYLISSYSQGTLDIRLHTDWARMITAILMIIALVVGIATIYITNNFKKN